MDKLTVGDIYKSDKYGDMEIVEYINATTVKVRFVCNNFETITTAQHIRNGTVHNRNYPTVHGVGFIGDGKYKAMIAGK